MTLGSDIIKRTASKSIENLLPYITDSTKDDLVYSPASFLLATAGLSAVSENFNNSAYGINNAEEDVKSLLEAWNFAEKEKSVHTAKDTYFKSCVLHQQVGETYAFDNNKQEKVSDNYISSMVSSFDTYINDAQKFFDKKIDIDLKIPDIGLDSDAVLTYSALKMKDTVVNGLGVSSKPFKYKNGIENTKAYSFGSETFPQHMEYYRGENYYVFKRSIRATELMIILPDDGADISSVNVKDAYDNYYLNKIMGSAYGYIPYFHNKTLGSNISHSITSNLNGTEILYSKLLRDDVVNDLVVAGVFQSNDFEFSQYGVSGSSITVIPGAGSPGPGEDVPINLSVDRPFYAISLMDDFPIFVNKVSNPRK